MSKRIILDENSNERFPLAVSVVLSHLAHQGVSFVQLLLSPKNDKGLIGSEAWNWIELGWRSIIAGLLLLICRRMYMQFGHANYRKVPAEAPRL